MENLNDLIWTDEEDGDNNDIQPQNELMYKKCMIAFCGFDSAGSSGYACSIPVYHTSACL